MYKMLIVAACLTAMISCHTKKPKQIKKNSLCFQLFENYKHLDSLSSIGMFSEFILPYYTNENNINSINIKLYYDKSGSKILQFPRFSVTGVFENYSRIYFNDYGKPFAMIRAINNRVKELFLFDIQKGIFFKDSVDALSESHIVEEKSFIDLSKQCEIETMVDILMHRYASLGRYSPTECLDSIEDFKVLEDSVPLYKNHIVDSGQIIDYLRINTLVKYKIVDTKVIELGGKQLYMVKIGIKGSQKSGWVPFDTKEFISIKEID